MPRFAARIYVSRMRCDDSAAVSDANKRSVTARACSYFYDLQRPQSTSRLSCFWAFLGTYSHYLGIYMPSCVYVYRLLQTVQSFDHKSFEILIGFSGDNLNGRLVTIFRFCRNFKSLRADNLEIINITTLRKSPVFLVRIVPTVGERLQERDVPDILRIYIYMYMYVILVHVYTYDLRTVLKSVRMKPQQRFSCGMNNVNKHPFSFIKY